MRKQRLTKALAVFLTASMLMQNMPISVFADNTAGTISASSAETSSEEAHSAEDTVAADEKETAKSDEDVGETGEAETNAETEETGAEKADVKTKENSVAVGGGEHQRRHICKKG